MFKSQNSLTARTLRQAALRIALVSVLAGAISYWLNKNSIEDGVRKQLILSTEQTLQRESLPFREIRDLQQNFLHEFKQQYEIPGNQARLAHDFDLIFYRHPDGSYTQRPGLFEGKPLADGRRFANMSATYAPDFAPTPDIKARFALSYQLSYKFGSSAHGRLFNFYGVVPEKGFPIYQNADIAKVFSYSGPNALKLETYEFYARGFASASHETLFTRMYWDESNAAWMTTIATPDIADTRGKHRILACVDVLLDQLMQRTARPVLRGSQNSLFLADRDGTLLYHPQYANAIKQSQGGASIRSLHIAADYPLLDMLPNLRPGETSLIETGHEIVALGIIPDTPWVLAVHYPKALMQPAILQNLAIVIAVGLLTLLVEIFIIRSILQKQVAQPLSRLMMATRQVGRSGGSLDKNNLPIHAEDEIGELARDFTQMAERVEEAHSALERKVEERTAALAQANQKLAEISTTDELTGIANRRRLDEVLLEKWNHSRRTGTNLTLAIIDVDWFKNYNDYYGHPAGDECLRKIAKLLKANAKRTEDLVARYGGEEFVMLLSIPDSQNALSYAQKICEAVEQALLPHEDSPFKRVTVSIGISDTVSGASSLEEFIEQADTALYRAKSQGRNRACKF